MSDYLLQEDSSSKFILEDGSGFLEQEFGEVDPSFIASSTTLHSPSLAYTGVQTTVTTAGTYQWLCPTGVAQIYVEAIAGGGGGTSGSFGAGGGNSGGGGGAYAARVAVPVTPGTLYTFVVGAAGSAGAGGASTNPGGDGGDSTFTGDSSTQVIAKGGKGGVNGTAGVGGSAASSTGDTGHKFSGGNGALSSGGVSQAGGGGASGNRNATGANASGNTGGAGANGGGSGGDGGVLRPGGVGGPGSSPGGAGGSGSNDNNAGGAGAAGSVYITTNVLAPFIASHTVVYAATLPVTAPFIASATVVYTPTLPAQLAVPFISSHTLLYAPSLPEVNAPFIASKTRLWNIFSLFDPNKTYSGPGNGGEAFLIRLAPNGVTNTATLAADITAEATQLELTGDGSFPTSVPFVVTIGSEVIYLAQIAPGSYRIRGRAMSNTTAAAHTAGATVSWGDSYDMALKSTANIDANFTAAINNTPSYTYDGWLICFDSSQGYLGGSRYPMHVAKVLGVFPAGTGLSGANRCDAAQPNAVCTPVGVSDSCPAALSNPALITTNIVAGDVALVRYTNPEASALDLGPRSTALQSWFGLKRVSSTDTDVTLTDPNGYVVDTIPSGPGPGPFTGSVNHEWPEPIPLAIGIAPDASDDALAPVPTPNPEPWTTVTLPGSDRYFTDGIHYSEKGWPMCCLAVRQGDRRIPHWQSWDWHDYGYVYTGFGTDDTFCQLLINRNGIVFDSVPAVELPGSQDIDGPDAVWDDATYYVGASWYVAIFGSPYIVFGPTIGGGSSGGGGGSASGGFAPGVGFPPGGGPPVISVPTVEGGSGGGIDGQPISNALFQAASV